MVPSIGCGLLADKFGHGAEQYAIHVAGEELPGHDPRFMPALATTYVMDATPGRHTQGGGWPPPGIKVRGTKMKYVYEGQAEGFYKLMTSMDDEPCGTASARWTANPAAAGESSAGGRTCWGGKLLCCGGTCRAEGGPSLLRRDL
jgi:hypothetical protein